MSEEVSTIFIISKVIKCATSIFGLFHVISGSSNHSSLNSLNVNGMKMSCHTVTGFQDLLTSWSRSGSGFSPDVSVSVGAV